MKKQVEPVKCWKGKFCKQRLSKKCVNETVANERCPICKGSTTIFYVADSGALSARKCGCNTCKKIVLKPVKIDNDEIIEIDKYGCCHKKTDISFERILGCSMNLVREPYKE